MGPRILGASTALLIGVVAANAQTPPSAPATPRDADGHPALAGVWNGPDPTAPPNIARQGADFRDFLARGGSFEGFEEDGGLLYHDYPSLPIYKPEFWDVIADNDYWGNWRDAGLNFCMPQGVPRWRAPNMILEIKGQPMYFFSQTGSGQTSNYWRLVPTDGRPHNAANVQAETYAGDPTGHWDGDTFVIESIGFTDNTWLFKNGYEHGFKMKVTERLTRQGNALTWVATVEDPDYLQEPWTTPPMTVYLNTAPGAMVAEALPCDSRIKEPWGTEDKPAIGASHTRSGDDQLVPPKGHDFPGNTFPRDQSWFLK